MDSIALIKRLHEHRAWVNGLLLDAAARLSDDALRREFPIGQGSVWQTLLHLHAAEYVWLETMLGTPDATLPGDVPGRLPGNQQGAGAIGSLAELRDRWTALEGRWRDHLDALQPAMLDEPVYRVSTSSNGGQKRATSRADILLHVCTHAQYTVAQVVNMLRQLGAENLPDVMLITLARSQHRENR